jgi:Holliday junction DNA helicase RuvA
MIDYIKGKIITKKPTSVVVDMGGFGIKVDIPISTSEYIGEKDDEVKLFTFVSIKNEELNIYGFATKPERRLFKKLVSVQGIGTKTALGILSEIGVESFERAVVDNDMDVLMAIHGIGPKTAKRIVFELREEMEDTSLITEAPPLKKDAIAALVSLGFKAKKARKVVESVLKEKKTESLEELIKETLKRL